MSKLLTMKNIRKRRASATYRTVDFPSLDHFVQDAQDAGITQVRIDIFPYSQASELSFVHYIFLVLYVTALDVEHQAVFQYQEAYDTQPSLSPDAQNEVALRRVSKRLSEVEHMLARIGFQTAHGRFVTDEL